MTYSTGVIEEHLKDIEILIENNVPIQKIMIVFDDVSFEITAEAFHSDLMRKAYCEYIRLGNRFYLPYLTQFDFDIFRQVLAGNVKTEHFYGVGDNIRGEEEFLPGEEKEYPAFRERPYTVPFDVLLEQIKSIKKLCEDNGIEVLFVTNPLWKNTFIYSCSDGYLDFLRQVADVTPFVNFSCLNEITCDSRNYYEGTHYRPNVGLLMLRILLDEDFEERESLASSQFGVWVTSDNADSVISSLQAQWELLPKSL